METFTFTPSGTDPSEAAAWEGLALLRDRLAIDFTAPYNDAADQRHELAVLAVDYARRLVDLSRRLSGSIDLDMVVLSKLTAQVRDERGDLSGDLAEARDLATLPVLHARVSEIDRALRFLVIAYKQRWFAEGRAAGS